PVKQLQEPSPFCNIHLGRDYQTNEVKEKTQNPVWNSVHHFLVSDPNVDILQLIALLPGQRQNPSGHDNTNIKRSLSLNKNFTDNTIPTEKPAESPTGNPEMVVRNRFPDDNDIISSTESLSTTNFDNQSVQPIRQVMTSNSIQQISNSSLGRIRLTIQFHCLSNYLEVTVHECQHLSGVDKDGLSDPYVKLYLMDLHDNVVSDSKKTKTVKDNLDPKYEENLSSGIISEHSD
ncbi:unnamed protein product, partial [Schistosoma mattheei]